MTDDKLARLPQWAQQEIRNLRTLVAALEQTQQHLLEEIHGVKAAETDTMLELSESGAEKPLGNGAYVRFADFYTVHYGDVGSGARALIIETDADMAVVPGYSQQIIVRRA